MAFDGTTITDPRLHGLYEYWRSKAGPRAMPARKDIDPTEMKPWIGNLILVEFPDDVLQFRVRLEGTNIVDFYGTSRTGRGIEALTNAQERELLLAQYGAVLDRREPAYYVARFISSEGKHVHQVKLLLPLSNDGQRVNMILGGIYFGRERGGWHVVGR